MAMPRDLAVELRNKANQLRNAVLAVEHIRQLITEHGGNEPVSFYGWQNMPSFIASGVEFLDKGLLTEIMRQVFELGLAGFLAEAEKNGAPDEKWFDRLCAFQQYRSEFHASYIAIRGPRDIFTELHNCFERLYHAVENFRSVPMLDSLRRECPSTVSCKVKWKHEDIIASWRVPAAGEAPNQGGDA
jgi:hypothetical protein